MKGKLLILLLLTTCHSFLTALSIAETTKITATFDRLSISDLQDIIVYLKSNITLSFDRERNEVLFLAASLLRQKTAELYQSQSETYSWDSLANDEVRLYRTQQVCMILEKILGREVFLNQDEAFVLSNGTPIVYREESSTFGLRAYKTPTLRGELYSGPILKVFEESLKYPDYSQLRWESISGEYVVYSPEYERNFRLNELKNLSDDQLIVLFGKLFPVSLEKPAWAWKIFGLTSMKREIKKLFENENKSRLSFNQR